MKKNKSVAEIDFVPDNISSNMINEELDDLTVIADYLQYNFNRLEVEQNKIFKILTIITVCISLPTLIVGRYGINFKYMPELQLTFGFHL
ncbi:CorA family divalent cation transporter [Flavobacterium frigoris]|uniref:CorA family divalent cation transporter n=1 Tax=Flavobacterium frigoris TaxID=229204 RepID=UPI001300C73F|nr:CorA family divalent cation transporter [Flavobacterium frigoris]